MAERRSARMPSRKAVCSLEARGGGARSVPGGKPRGTKVPLESEASIEGVYEPGAKWELYT